jgi:hypothetical protein
MVGRIELVTPEQRQCLSRLANAPVPERPLPNLAGLRQSAAKREEVPAAYLALGRFRNALIRDEQQQRPTESLRAFIKLNGLDEYQP